MTRAIYIAVQVIFWACAFVGAAALGDILSYWRGGTIIIPTPSALASALVAAASLSLCAAIVVLERRT
jgi:hypothetical protein